MKVTKGYSKSLAENYFRENQKYNKKYGPREWPRFIHLLGSLKGKKVLDAGCGYGYEANLLNKKSAKVFGIDASPRIIEIAKKEHSHLAKNFSVGNLKKLPFKNNYFDVIISKFAIHYLSSPDIAYKEFFRCLKKKGALIVLAPHPISQLLFKKSKKYFNREKIEIELFKGVRVVQPTQRLSDYFSKYFFDHFDLQYFEEGRDLDSFHSKMKVPEYLLIKAVKR